MGSHMGPGTMLAGRYRLEDLLTDSRGARFWRGTDTVLARSVAVHAVPSDDERAGAILEAARVSATVTDPHFLRVLDCDDDGSLSWVINEWGEGLSLDLMLQRGPLPPARAAWLAREVAEAITAAHARGVHHGRLNPESVLVTDAGAVKLIGAVTNRALAGPRDPSPVYGDVDGREADVIDLAGVLYAALTGKWPGISLSAVPSAPFDGRKPFRPRQVRAGIPRTLDMICDRVLCKEASRHVLPIETAHEIAAALSDFVGDPATAAPIDVPDMFAEPPPPPSPAPEELPVPPSAAASGPAASAAAASGAVAGRTPPTDDPDATVLAGPLEDADAEATAVVPTAGAAGAAGAAPPGAARATDDTSRQPAVTDGPVEETPHRPVPTTPGDTPAGTPSAVDPEATIASPSLRAANPSTPPTPFAAAETHDVRGDAPVPAPPPFEQPAERPLFADHERRVPANAPVAPVARTAGTTGRTGGGSSTGAGRPTGTGTGAGMGAGMGPGMTGTGSGAYWPFVDEEDDTGSFTGKEGRGWLRLAGVVALVIAVMAGVFLAFTLGRNGDPPAETPATANPSSAIGSPVDIVGVSDFDPEASPPEENPEQAPLAIDESPTTGWRTSTYRGNPELGGLKTGVGLMLDLGADRQVGSVSISFVGAPTQVELYAARRGTNDPPADLGELEQITNGASADTSVVLRPDEKVTTRFVVVWLTRLPEVDGGFRAEVTDIKVHS